MTDIPNNGVEQATSRQTMKTRADTAWNPPEAVNQELMLLATGEPLGDGEGRRG